MIELPIPDEITKYEPKIIGKFTARQALFGGVGLAGAILGYNYFKDMVSQNVLFTGIIIFIIPFALFGWAKPYGLPLEKFISTVLLNMFISPSRRSFATADTLKPYEKDKYALKKTATAEEIKQKERERKQDEKKRIKALNACKGELFE